VASKPGELFTAVCRGYLSYFRCYHCVQRLLVVVLLPSVVTEVLHVIVALGCTTFEKDDPLISFGVVASHALGQPFDEGLYGKCKVLDCSVKQ